MAETMKLQVITPDKEFFHGDVSMVELNTADGELGVYPQHIPLTTAAAPGVLKIHQDGQVKKAAGRNVKKTLPAKTCDLRLHPALKKKTPLFPQSPSPLIKADGIYIPCDLHLILIIIADPKVPSVDGKPVFSSLDL